jgi:hypothetical protein
MNGEREEHSQTPQGEIRITEHPAYWNVELNLSSVHQGYSKYRVSQETIMLQKGILTQKRQFQTLIQF